MKKILLILPIVLLFLNINGIKMAFATGNIVLDQDIGRDTNFLSGKVKPGSSVAIYGYRSDNNVDTDENIQIIGSTTASTDGRFVLWNLHINENYYGVSLKVTNRGYTENFDYYFPLEVKNYSNYIYDYENQIGLTTEYGANVKIFANNNLIKEGSSSSNYNSTYFNIPYQKPGTILSYLIEGPNNRVARVDDIVVKSSIEEFGPNLYKPITDKTNTVSVTTRSKNSYVKIFNSQDEVIAEGPTQKGDIINDIPIKKQIEGTKLKIIAYDEWGNASKPLEIVVGDGTPPRIPTHNIITDKTTKVYGKAESNTKIILVVEDQVYKTTVASKGKYEIKINKLFADTPVWIQSVDESGNESSTKTFWVKDKTAPPTPKVINKVTYKTKTIKGLSECEASVFIYSKNKLIGSGQTNKKGEFFIKISTQKRGSILSITAQDKSGNESKSLGIKVN